MKRALITTAALALVFASTPFWPRRLRAPVEKFIRDFRQPELCPKCLNPMGDPPPGLRLRQWIGR